MSEHGPDPHLEYRNRNDDRPPFKAGHFAAGILFGMVAVGCVGAHLSSIHVQHRRGVPPPAHPGLPVVIFFAVVAFTSAILLVLIRWRGPYRRTFLLGFVLAVGVVSLVEGTCFSGM